MDISPNDIFITSRDNISPKIIRVKPRNFDSLPQKYDLNDIREADFREQLKSFGIEGDF